MPPVLGNLPQVNPLYHATGSAAAPAAAAVVADTGPMEAGDYEIAVNIGSDDTAAAGKHALMEHRNAANDGTLHRKLMPVPGHAEWRIPRIAIAKNERVRVITGAAAAAGTTYTGDVYARKV